MTRDELLEALLVERYGTPTPEWQPTLLDKVAAGKRVLHLERTAQHDERVAS